MTDSILGEGDIVPDACSGTPTGGIGYCCVVEDSELVAGVRSNDQACWNELVERHSDFLWRLARSTVNDDTLASDAMQTAWMQLLEHLDDLDRPAQVRSWLATTTYREAMALSIAAQRQPAVDPHDWGFDRPTDVADDPAERSAKNSDHAVVVTALRSLSERCQQLLTMIAHKIPYKEIAATLDMAIGGIGPTSSRCLEKLRADPAIVQLEVTR